MIVIKYNKSACVRGETRWAFMQSAQFVLPRSGTGWCGRCARSPLPLRPARAGTLSTNRCRHHEPQPAPKPGLLPLPQRPGGRAEVSPQKPRGRVVGSDTAPTGEHPRGLGTQGALLRWPHRRARPSRVINKQALHYPETPFCNAF